ncbi:MAG TPA: acyltransferase family protein [Caldilineaceae bacterium]|nr:acyltransferase family protein [Caldilineaceae bacterium]
MIVQPAGRVVGQAAPLVQASAQTKSQASRLYFIDNLRWALTALVVLHHLSITYGAEGSWYYVEQPIDPVTHLVLTAFTGLNQGYFMGLFFLIGGYFAALALARKSTGHFIRDRLWRLGAPLVFFAFLVSPLMRTSAWLQSNPDASAAALWSRALAEWQRLTFAPGPLWFVETLLVLSAVYALGRLLWRRLHPQRVEQPARPLTSGRMVILALLIALVSFVTRLYYPIGAEWQHLQLGFFPQYIALFCAGIWAYQQRWLPDLPAKVQRTWSRVAGVAILALPAMMLLIGADGGVQLAFGGWHWQAAGFALWEAFYALSMSVALLALFRRRFDRQGALSRTLSASAYTVYLIHAPVIVALAYSLRMVAWPPLLKFAVLAGPAVAICFALAYLSRWLFETKRFYQPNRFGFKQNAH